MAQTIIKNCLKCQKEFSVLLVYHSRGQGKFCSRSCSSSHNVSKRNSKLKVYCVFCGKSLDRKQSQVKNCTNSFCNIECKKNFEYKGNVNIKRSGTQRRLHLEQKLSLINKYGIVCMVLDCKNDLMGNREIIDMHHFAGSFDHSKTVLLCPYHHRLADKKIIDINSIIQSEVTNSIL